MNRRELLTIAGAAVALTSLRADAAPSGTHDYATLTNAAASCVRAAEACLRHCIAMLSSGNNAVAGCAKAVADLGPAAQALASIAPGGSRNVAPLAAVVGQIAKDCKAECDKHATMAPCKACSDSCAALIAEVAKA